MSPEQNEPYRWYHDTVDHVPQHPHHDHVVDRCADRCDDQLPLFSQVGRGLQGDGYRVELVKDTINDTRIRGLIIDPHTGEETEEWRTDNINGGRLSYSLNYNPTTDPKTFTITFTLERPDDSQRPEGEKRGWTFTTKPIPYLWENEIRPCVATLFTKAVSQPSNYWRERLVYPAGTGPEDYDMPRKLEPWTVNLTYGKTGDIDCPTTSEEQADIDAAKQEVLNHLHKDLYGGQDSDDWDEIPDSLKPLDGDKNNGRTVWDWIKWARDQAINHLHKDLYGGPNSSDYADIPDSLKPLDGDNNNGRTVWDWIKWLKGMIDGVSAPTMHTKDLEDTYLVSIKPTPLSADTAITPLCAIEADVHIQYFDSLPNVIIDIDIQNKPLDYISDVAYGDSTLNGIRLGTAEMAVICRKIGPNTYKPLDLSTITLPDRSEISNKLTYPKVDPEILSNSGFGWAGYYNFTDKHGYKNRTGEAGNYSYANRLYPGITESYEQIVDGSCYGNWELYTGLGNVKSNQNSRWNENGTGVFAYIFNRTTGSFGVRVLLDYNRPYQINYIQAK